MGNRIDVSVEITEDRKTTIALKYFVVYNHFNNWFCHPEAKKLSIVYKTPTMRIEFFIMILFLLCMMILQKRKGFNKDWNRDI